MTQVRAGELLKLGPRPVKRLISAYRRRGDRGLASGKRGRRSNNRLDRAEVERIEAALRDRYVDFGATLAAEKLAEHEGITVSKKTVRQMQVRLGLHVLRARRRNRAFQLRERRPRFGELIQIDGPAHDWLEGCGPRMTLIVFIDDASGRLTSMRFCPAETTRAYRQALRAHILAHGVPLALCSDRHGIFRINAKDVDSGDGLTELGRVLARLSIDQICAWTPQAKGRVERANKTLQDRLIKEMRLAGIADMAAAQAILEGFMARHTSKFAGVPRAAEDAHRPWSEGAEALNAALAIHEPRTLSKALSFSAGGAVPYIATTGASIALRGAKVVVRRYLDGRMDVVFKDRVLGPHDGAKAPTRGHD